MKFLTTVSLSLIAVTVHVTAEETDIFGRELQEKTRYCIQENLGSSPAKYKYVKWDDGQKSNVNNANRIVDDSICVERLDEKQRYCINQPKEGEEYRYSRPNWNLQTVESPAKQALLVDEALCEEYLDKKDVYCINAPLEGQTYRYIRPRWPKQTAYFNSDQLRDESECHEYLSVKKRYCVYAPPSQHLVDVLPAMVHSTPLWNKQTSIYRADDIIDMSSCEATTEYCVKYGTDAEPQFRRKMWTLPEAENGGNYPRLADMAECEKQEEAIALKAAQVKAEQERLKAEAEAKRAAERQERDDAFKSAEARRKAAKAEKDALRKELLVDRDVSAAQDELTAAEQRLDMAHERAQEAAAELEECEKQAGEIEAECDVTPHGVAILNGDVKFAESEVKRFSLMLTRIQGILKREAESQARKKQKAEERAARQAGKRAQMEAKKKLAANKKKSSKPKGNFPPRDGTCFKDHICAKISGDPHITTFDGMRYDCQGSGEFVLVRDLDSQFEVQGRFVDARTNTDGNMITITKAVSIDTGVVVDGVPVPAVDIVAEDLGDSDNKACTINYYIDGKPAIVGKRGEMRDRDGKFVDDDTIPFYDVNGTIIQGIELYDGSSDQLYFPDSGVAYSTGVRYGNFGCVLNNHLCIHESMAGPNIVGLFGSPDDDTDNDWMEADGTVVIHGGDLSDEHGYSYCTQNWCVTEEESIFGYMEDESYDTFYGCDRPYNKNKPSVLVEEATEECQACCADVLDLTANNDCLLECVEGDIVDCDNFKVIEDTFNRTSQCSVDDKTLTTTLPDKTTGPPPTTPDALTQEDITTPTTFVKGDPHFKTFGGELYDFHGECDLVLLHNPEFRDRLGMDVHIRTKIEDFWSSVETAALKLGDGTLEIHADPESKEWLWINGEEVGAAKETGKWHRTEVGGFLVRFKSNGKNREAKIYLEGDKEGLAIKTFKNFVHVDIAWKDSDDFRGSTGLLGSYAENGLRVGRDGKFIEDINAFGQEWQVRADEPQLFHSYEGAVLPTNKCTMPPTIGEKVALRKRRLANGMDVAVAEKACAHLSGAEFKACVFDVIATQDTTMASVW